MKKCSYSKEIEFNSKCLRRDLAVKLTRLRTQLNEFDESFNEKKKRFKFDIQLAEEREELAKIDGLDEVDA